MAKLVIGKSFPLTFALLVKVPTPTGEGEVTFTAKHMATTVWAKLREQHAEAIGKTVQSLFDAARAEAETTYQAQLREKLVADSEAAGSSQELTTATDDPEGREAAITALIKPVKESEIAALRARHSAELIAQIITGWDLGEPLDVEVLTDLCDRYPGAAEATFKAYNETREGLRLGNSGK